MDKAALKKIVDAAFAVLTVMAAGRPVLSAALVIVKRLIDSRLEEVAEQVISKIMEDDGA